MKTWKKIILIIVSIIVIMIIIGAILAYIGGRDSSPVINKANLAIYNVLANAGLKDIVVDVQEKKALVYYNIENESMQEGYIPLTAGAVYSTAPSVEKLIIVEFKNLKPYEEIEINMENLKKFGTGELSEQDLINTFIRKSINQ